MGKLRIAPGGGGADLDVITATAADIVAPKVIVDKDGEPITGTMPDRGDWSSSELAAGASVTVPAGKHWGGGKVTAKSLASQTQGTAVAGHILNGDTATVNGALITGNMSVNSVLSFSAAAYGGKQILLKWQNPYAATGKPYSGVEIRYATGSYPGAGGTVIYTGAGNNTAPGGWSQVVVTLPAFGTGYYFSLRPYVNTSLGTLYGSVLNAYAATQAELWLTFTGSQTYTLPAGYTKMDVFAVGGGGGSYSNGIDCGDGGGGGYAITQRNIAVSGGQAASIVVGAGGVGNNGSSSVVTINGSAVTAQGGKTGSKGSGGGSGGGGCRERRYSGYKYGGRGGSDGSNGYSFGQNSDTDGSSYSSGQGTTTRAWGSGTLYAGGGGGGNGSSSLYGGAGGAGGGASGASARLAVNSASANTGGGAGGPGWTPDNTDSSAMPKGSGGSGIVLLHIY